MSDITERLRDACGNSACRCTLNEAADEIDRLWAAIREYLAAYDAASDPQATGSTCRLIRAEGELRRAVDGEPSHD